MPRDASTQADQQRVLSFFLYFSFLVLEGDSCILSGIIAQLC